MKRLARPHKRLCINEKHNFKKEAMDNLNLILRFLFPILSKLALSSKMKSLIENKIIDFMNLSYRVCILKFQTHTYTPTLA